MPNAWMVRAGDDNELVDVFLKKHIVAIGWKALGDATKLKDREDFKRAYALNYPDHSPGKMNVNAGQVYRFVREATIGDLVLTFDKSLREYKMGEITSDAKYDPASLPAYPNIRSVQWLKSIRRDALSTSAKNTLGSILTVFSFNSCAEEINAKVDNKTTTALVESEEEAPYSEEVRARAEELIADLVSALDAYDFQHLVGGVLKSMGFRIKESDPGRDSGIDIVAMSDAFGFTPPKIKVQVKHRVSKSSGPDIRSFTSALDPDDKGIFISTGGFTTDAKTEALRAGGRLSLMDRDDFIALMLENYEKMEPTFQAMVPLMKVWLPARS